MTRILPLAVHLLLLSAISTACSGPSNIPDADADADADASIDAVDAVVDAIDANAPTDVPLVPGRTCTITPPVPSDWRLHTDGPLIRDALGRIVFLRGVNAGGRSKFAPYMPFEYTAGGFDAALASYFDRAASWGIDVMRVPFTWAALEPTQGTDDADWLMRYQQLVDAAWAHGIWTIVDFHQDVYSENFCGDGFPAWTIPAAPAPTHDCPMWSMEYFSDTGVTGAFDRFWPAGSAVQTAYLAAWDVMISRFANAAGVIGFEPINEPGWGTQDEATFESTTLSDFYARVVPHMRALAPSTLVFVEPTGYAGVLISTQLQRPMGDGIVFAPHYYPLITYSTAGLVQSLRRWMAVGTSWNVPVFIGEFGGNNTRPDAEAYMASHFAAFDVLGIGGTMWEYSVANELWNSEMGSVVAGDGTEFPVAQALVRPFARAVAGSGVDQQWDGAVFTLTYMPSSGITEVQMPARAFPHGRVVALTGGCYDATSVPGRLLVQPDADAAMVTLTVAPGM